MKKYTRRIFTILLLFSSYLPAQSSLTVAGTGDSQVLLRLLGQQFETVHPGLTIKVPDSIGSGGGLKAILRGKADLARTARPLEEKEKPGLVEILFAKSPIVFVVHTTVTGITHLTMEQIQGIYAGKYRNWQELGGPDHKIYVVDREADDSSRRLITQTFPAFSPLDSVVTIAYSTPETVNLLAKNLFTIGYLPLSVAQHDHLTILALDGVIPTAPSYPLVTPFYLVSKVPPTDLAKQFIEFVWSPPAQQIMKETGVLTVSKNQ